MGPWSLKTDCLLISLFQSRDLLTLMGFKQRENKNSGRKEQKEEVQERLCWGRCWGRSLSKLSWAALPFPALAGGLHVGTKQPWVSQWQHAVRLLTPPSKVKEKDRLYWLFLLFLLLSPILQQKWELYNQIWIKIFIQTCWAWSAQNVYKLLTYSSRGPILRFCIISLSSS